MKKRLACALAVLAVVVLVASCGEKVTDEAAIRALVEQDTTYFKSGTQGDSAAGGGLLDDTMLGLWWRGPQTHDPQPRIEVEIVEDSARVSWHQSNYGELIHWVRTSDTTSERWVKELTERVQLNAIFLREGGETETNRGWRFKRLSLAYGQSDTVSTVRIDSLRIQSSLRDFTITDPLNSYHSPDSLVSFTPGEQLTMTLYTNTSDCHAFLHAFVGWLFVRAPFEHQGDGVHVGTWNAQLIPGLRFAIFDILSTGTLLERTGPYDHNGWLLPYAIKTAD
ncbi:MAG: hypothetical protein R6X14_06395 [bacterium]